MATYKSRHTGSQIDSGIDASHSHANKSTLDKFGESAGSPTFGGQPIGSGGSGTPPEWYIGLKLLVSGDSIALLWGAALRDEIFASGYKNVALASASLTDFEDTVHNGDPSSTASNNTMTNQFLQVKAQKKAGTYTDIPDIIVIAFGTNNDREVATLDIEPEFTTPGGWTYINLDALNLVGNIPACLRWVVEQYRADDMYPNAKIFLCSPPQTSANMRSSKMLKQKADCIRLTANRLGVGYADVLTGSGIYGPFEVYNGSGRYLKDGLHPNDAGIAAITDTIIASMKNVRDTDGATSFIELTGNTVVRDFGEGTIVGVSNGKIVPRRMSSGIDYSTDPQLTGLLWTGGEPIYQNTIPIGTLSNAGTKTASHGLSGMAMILSHELSTTIPYTPSDVQINVDGTNIVVTTARDMSAINAWVTLRYINASAIKLTNLITNGDFSNGTTGWTISGANAQANADSTATLTRVSTAAGSQMYMLGNLSSTIPIGHIAYARAKSQGILMIDEVASSAFRQVTVTVAGSDNLTAGASSARQGITTVDMLLQSAYGVLTKAGVGLTLYFGVASGTVFTGSTATFGEVVVVDLTAAFGAGNEPDKAWCDANIPFFSDTITI